MKTYYLYVPDGDGIGRDSAVIWLVVGSSSRELTRLALLQSYAMDLGQFLRKRDVDTDFWLESHAKRLFPESNCPRLHFQTVEIGIMECYRRIIDGTLEAYVNAYEKPINFLKTLLILDANFMRNHSKKIVLRKVPSGKRKYLSHKLEDYSLGGIICLAIIALGAMTDFLGMFIINLLSE